MIGLDQVGWPGLRMETGDQTGLAGCQGWTQETRQCWLALRSGQQEQSPTLDEPLTVHVRLQVDQCVILHNNKILTIWSTMGNFHHFFVV
jgi:hypothetical protein